MFELKQTVSQETNSITILHSYCFHVQECMKPIERKLNKSRGVEVENTQHMSQTCARKNINIVEFARD